MEQKRQNSLGASVKSRGSSVDALSDLKGTLNVRRVSKKSRDSLLSENEQKVYQNNDD